MGAMGCGKGIIAINISQIRQTLGQLRIIALFAGFESNIFNQNHLVFGKSDGFAGAIQAGEFHWNPERRLQGRHRDF